MKKKIIYLNFLLALMLLTIPTLLKSQVTIGLLEDPQEGAALEVLTKNDTFDSSYPDIESLENSNKGVLFPKVRLEANNSLAPLYANPSVEQSYRAIGMVVYNINSGATNLDLGLYVWDSEKWVALAGISAPVVTGKSIVEVNCDNIRVYGSYNMDEAISDQSVSIEVDVNVTKMGTYEYYASSHGILFSAAGTFTKLGTATVTLSPASGTLENTTAGNKALSVVINGVGTEDDNNICFKTLSFIKTGAGSVIKILNIGGTNDDTGLTKTGDNYNSSSVYAGVAKWLNGSLIIEKITVPNTASYYAGGATISIVDMKRKTMTAASLRAELETTSIVWMGAYKDFPYASVIKEWHDKGNGVIIATGDVDNQAAVPNALGYIITEDKDVDAISVNMTSANFDGLFLGSSVPFKLTNGLNFRNDGANGGRFLSYPATAVTFMASEKDYSRPMGLADMSNRAFIFADKYGDCVAESADYWQNYAKVLVDIFAWAFVNSTAY